MFPRLGQRHRQDVRAIAFAPLGRADAIADMAADVFEVGDEPEPQTTPAENGDAVAEQEEVELRHFPRVHLLKVLAALDKTRIVHPGSSEKRLARTLEVGLALLVRRL